MLIRTPNLNHRSKEDDHQLIKWEISRPYACLSVPWFFGLWSIQLSIAGDDGKQGRIHDTISRGGWAGAVIWRAGAVGDAVYMTAAVACGWAGAMMRKPLAKRRKSKWWTDQPTDHPTDRPTARD